MICVLSLETQIFVQISFLIASRVFGWRLTSVVDSKHGRCSSHYQYSCLSEDLTFNFREFLSRLIAGQQSGRYRGVAGAVAGPRALFSPVPVAAMSSFAIDVSCEILDLRQWHFS